MDQRKYSIVTPIRNEVKRLERTLPTFYKVNPSEVIICTDDPSPEDIIIAVKRISKEYNMEDKTVILAVARNPEFADHQAWVRRLGFHKAKYDVILTTDIDLEINKNVLKAVNLVGKDNIGLVSLSKFRPPFTLINYVQTFGYFLLRVIYFSFLRHLHRGNNSGKGLRFTLFTGLYAFYRPYWLETEDEGIKKLVPTAWQQDRLKMKVNRDAYNVGEDNYLRDCMEKKYRVMYLARLGATVIDRDMHRDPRLQYQRGRYNARRGRSILGAIIHSLITVEPQYLKGFTAERRRKDKKT